MSGRWWDRDGLLLGIATLTMAPGLLAGYALLGWSGANYRASAFADSLFALRDSVQREYVAPLVPHEDKTLLLRAARAHGIPPIVMYAVTAVESGYRARYDVRGRNGEYGRMQVRYELWGQSSGECASGDPESQVRCGAQRLEACRHRYGTWVAGVACYNSFSRPDRNGRYVRLVEQAIGRMVLRGVDP